MQGFDGGALVVVEAHAQHQRVEERMAERVELGVEVYHEGLEAGEDGLGEPDVGVLHGGGGAADIECFLE